MAKARVRCGGKVRYRDQLAAKIALASASRPGGSAKRDETRFYRCPRCAGWHLTSQAKRA